MFCSSGILLAGRNDANIPVASSGSKRRFDFIPREVVNVFVAGDAQQFPYTLESCLRESDCFYATNRGRDLKDHVLCGLKALISAGKLEVSKQIR